MAPHIPAEVNATELAVTCPVKQAASLKSVNVVTFPGLSGGPFMQLAAQANATTMTTTALYVVSTQHATCPTAVFRDRDSYAAVAALLGGELCARRPRFSEPSPRRLR